MVATKHIVFIVPGFPKDEEDFLCAPPLQQLIRELQSSNVVEISILAIHYPYAPRTYSWNGVNVVSLGGNNARGWRKLKYYRKAISHLNDLHRAHTIDVVHSFWLSDASLVGSRWTKRNKIPHCITFMGQEAETASIYRRFVRKTDRLIALSSAQKKRIETRLKLTVTDVIPFGIRQERWIQTERSTDILGVGSLIAVKNYRQFIETIARMQAQRSLKVRLIGDGPLRAELEELAKEKNASIEFLGIMERTAVLAEMQKAKVLFHPSYSESLGFVFLEALMSGASIVSNEVGIASDVHSENWSIVKDNGYERALLAQLSRTSAREAEVPFDISNTAAHYLKLWRIK